MTITTSLDTCSRIVVVDADGLRKRMRYVSFHRQKINGVNGLAISIISQAAKDAVGHTDALEHDDVLPLQFFNSEWYRFLIGSLGLPLCWLPQGLERRNLERRNKDE